MKSVVLLAMFGFCLVVQADKEFDDKYEKIVKECFKEGNVDENSVDVPMDKMPKEGKCVMACILKKTDVMMADGSIDTKAAKAGIEQESEKFSNTAAQEIFIRIMKECTKEVQPVPDDLCETAYNWLVCQQKKYNSAKE